MTAPFVDAHLHFWDRTLFDYPWLDAAGPEFPHRYLPADVADPGSMPAAVVFVQADCAPAQGLAEARWASALVREIGTGSAVVAFAPLEDPGLPAHLDALAAIPGVVGVRRLLQDEPAEFLTSDAVVAGLRRVAAAGLVFDACVRHHQLDALVALGEAVPEARIVLDHLGKPPVREGWGSTAAERWHAAIRALADRPRTAVKLSGLAPESDPSRPLAQTAPFLDAALEAFGPGRCMAGSDFPVSGVVPGGVGYREWFDEIGSLLPSDADRDAVLRATALAVYREDTGASVHAPS